MTSFGYAKDDKFFILDYKGQPKIERRQEGVEDSKISKVVKKEIIRGQAVIHTDAKSEVVIQIDANAKLKIYPESEVLFPHISWEKAQAESFILKSGKIRWESESDQQLTMISDLYELPLPKGVFLISYNPKTPLVQVMCFKGEISFHEKNGEESSTLKAGKKSYFLGKIEDGEIAYDILLQGRKIPKGQKSQIEDISNEEIKLYSPEEELKQAEVKKKKNIIIESKKPKRLNEICQKPGGLYNECAWICENNPKEQTKCRLDLSKVKCVRKRCNANGVWAERSELDLISGTKLCKVNPVVQACDY